MAHGDIVLETGFEFSSGLPAGWTENQISGSAATWTIQQGGGANGGSGPSLPNSGSNNATLFINNTNDSITRLITPTFDTDGYTTTSLTFWHTQKFWSPDQDELKVFFSSDGGSTWTQLAHYTGDTPDWTQRTLNLPTTSANSQIAFEGNAKYGYGVCLDDIVVTGSPSFKSTFSISATDADASEVGPDSGSWTITRTGNTTGAVSLVYTLSGTATQGSDYTVDTPSPISFAAGQTSAIVTLLPVDDTVGGERDEVATLTLTEDTDYFINASSAGISIYDDDPADLNILVIGSTNSYSDRESGLPDVSHEKPFNPAGIASHLEEIIDQHQLITDSVNVVHDSIYKEKNQVVNYSGSSTYSFTSRCYSLAQHYMWPEGKDARLADLRGEGDTEWDYIVLSFDPYILANFPGMVAEGVKLIQDAVSQSANPAQVVLLAQWPENSSTFSVGDFNEVVYRVGNSADLPVVPAGKAWDSLPSQDTNAAHPTPNGEYLAAAAIYSWLYDNSASSSNYTYVDASTTSAIADHALSVVQANAGASQYTGDYTDINPFKMKYVNKRVVSFRETGTSTEDRIRNALTRLDDVQRITFSTSGYAGGSGTRWDFNYGRGNDWWEDDKDYEVDPNKYDRSYGFPMHHYTTSNAPITMPYGIDKHYQNGITYEDGTDLGIAYNMIRPNTRELSLPEDVRAIPIRLMWLKMREVFPGFNPLGDSTHMNNHLNDATAAFMYTLLSGRCPVVEEPATQGSSEWQQWLGHKIGYETAWQMAHLTTRAPGFRVLPSSTSATTVTPTSTETMTVQFVNPPQADVTVTVLISNPTAAIAGPKTLVFTPSNYNTPQAVTVAGIPGASGSEAFEVVFSTSSDDEVYDGLSDAWRYTNNRSSTVAVTQVDNGTSQVVTAQYNAVDISLNVAGANASNTIFTGPANGSITWSGSADIEYTPSGDYLGTDQIVYAVTIGGTQTIGSIDITVQFPDGQVSATAGDAAASEEGPDNGTFVISRFGDTTDALDVFFSMSGTATPGSDYTLSHTSPVTIPAGQNSVILTLTPVDDAVFGEEIESAILTITEDAAYPIGIASATISIADNDNNAPVANAGPDQNVILSGSAPWSPAQTTTELWLDAADDSTITRSGDLVSEWRDKSDNDRHASQATSGSQPSWTFEGLNGKDVLTFDGTSEFLNLGTGLDFVAGTSHSAFIVLADITSYSNIYGAANGNSGSSSLHVGFANANTYRMNYWSHDYGPSITANFESNGSILNYVWEVGAPKQILANGKSEGTGHNAQAIGTMAGGGRIGNIVGQGFIGGKIAEMVFLTGTVAQADRERMEGYLAHKWGLAGNLASSHPYKNQAPGGSGVLVNLNGTVTDEDGQTPTSLWTKVSGPGVVLFGDASAVDTTATFTQAGTYVLRLAADDSYAQTFDEVTITVTTTQSFAGWIFGYDLDGQIAPQDDFDGDGIPNAVENYFGTHPGTFNPGLALTQVTTGGAGDSIFTFTHPISDNPAADLTASYRWSNDLSSFHGNGDTESGGTKVDFIAGTPSNGEVTVTATVSGTETDRVFVTVEVILE